MEKQQNNIEKAEKEQVQQHLKISEIEQESDAQNKNNQSEEQGDDDDQFDESHPKWRKIPQPKDTIKLFMIDFNQCDSKKCSGRKMQRFNLIKSLKDKKPKFKGIVLSAHGSQVISKEDLEIVKKSGICVIDCSWKRIKQTENVRFKHQRILPYVIAGNPVNYGKPFQLSCVQACATALCALDYIPQAEYIMSKFGWADGFWSLNPKITSYASCKDMQELQQMSEILQQQIQQKNETCKYRRYDLSSSESSDQQQEGQTNGNKTNINENVLNRQGDQSQQVQSNQ